jgi:hypothetical protein
MARTGPPITRSNSERPSPTTSFSTAATSSSAGGASRARHRLRDEIVFTATSSALAYGGSSKSM